MHFQGTWQGAPAYLEEAISTLQNAFIIFVGLKDCSWLAGGFGMHGGASASGRGSSQAGTGDTAGSNTERRFNSPYDADVTARKQQR